MLDTNPSSKHNKEQAKVCYFINDQICSKHDKIFVHNQWFKTNKELLFLIVSLISKTQKMMKKRDNTKSKKLVWDLVEDKQVVPKNEDPGFVPTIWRHNFSKQQMKSKEKIVTQATIKKRNKAVRIYERKRKQHQNRDPG